MNPKNFWTKYTFAVNQTRLFKIGYSEVFIRHIQNGWLIKSKKTDSEFAELEVEEVAGIDDDSDVLHFHTGKSHDLIVIPALPEKSVVFRNNKNLKITAGEATNLFLRVPVNLQFYFQEVKDENRMLDLPTKRLSDTWFGEIDSGEPAFSIGSNYDKSFADVKAMDWEAILSVEIINNTSGSLDLQRLILHVEEFHLYLKNKQLLTNYATIEFKGQEQAGSVNLSVRKEIHGEKPVQLAKPRNSDTRNLLRRSFFFIKNIYQN
ncbi:MAG: DUF432 domain-containing protein [Prolixibacteraceae bacterium]